MDPREIARHITRKKSVHVEMPSEVHTQLRAALFRNGNISIQALVREIAIRVATHDPIMMSIIEDMQVRRLDTELKGISKTDAEDLFNILERVSPLGSGG